MEVFLATGRPLTDWQADGRTAALEVPWRGLVMAPPNEVLRARFLPRLQAMAEAGLVEEVRAFLATGPDPLLPLSRAVGMAPLRRHVAGEIGLAAALALADIDTRHYAKRQLTWARKHMADWLWLETAQQMESLVDQSLSFIQI
jgi:tRNA dimethylallyltransferase